MDEKWFKRQHKIAGVTVHDLGEALGRDRSIVSRIYQGHQKMTHDQAKVFARVLQQPLSEVLVRAGLTDASDTQALQRGFSESDVARWIPAPADEPNSIERIAEILGAGKSGMEIWRVKGRAMALAGYLDGDFILVDQKAASSAAAGDTVIAQVYDRQVGGATTLLRRYDPPILAAASVDPDWKAYVVDNNNISITGVVTASWRL